MTTRLCHLKGKELKGIQIKKDYKYQEQLKERDAIIESICQLATHYTALDWREYCLVYILETWNLTDNDFRRESISEESDKFGVYKWVASKRLSDEVIDKLEEMVKAPIDIPKEISNYFNENNKDGDV